MRIILLAGGLVALVAGAAQAGIPVTVQMTCAVGGESFTHIRTASYSTWGSRPDGKPYGSWTFPLAIPECPTNRLVMYRDFTDAEKETLAPLIARPDYAAMREENSYFRAAWLARMLGDGEEAAAWLMLRAVWQAEPGTPVRARYLALFAEQVQAMPHDPDRLEGAVLRLRAANALRELGRFDAAMAMIEATPISDTAAFADEDAADAPEARGNVGSLADQFRRLIVRRDQGAEPVDAMPPREAAFRCIDTDAALTPFEREYCQGALAEAVAELRKLRAERGD
ncbi:hypothetical protein ACPVPU_06315 [Sphingomonas sp. CJ99]